MALFVKEDKSEKSEAGLKSPLPSSGPLPTGKSDVQAHLGQGSRIEGKLTFEGQVRIAQKGSEGVGLVLIQGGLAKTFQ